MTAMSVMMRSTRRSAVRQGALGHDLGRTLGGVLHGHDHPVGAGHQIHRAAHARHHLARHDPVGQTAFLVDLKAAQHRGGKVATAHQTERKRAVDRHRARHGPGKAAASIGQRGVFQTRRGLGAQTHQAVFGMEEDAALGET
jgi:hypothetical protein